jgi:hypothetical protein
MRLSATPYLDAIVRSPVLLVISSPNGLKSRRAMTLPSESVITLGDPSISAIRFWILDILDWRNLDLAAERFGRSEIDWNPKSEIGRSSPVLEIPELPVNVPRTVRLKFHHDFARRVFWRNHQQGVNVIFDPADRDGGAIDAAGDSANVSPDPVFDRRGNPFLPELRTENGVIEK